MNLSTSFNEILLELAQKKVILSAVCLDLETQKKLLEFFKDIIPADWGVHAHHMTIANKKSLEQIELSEDEGKTVEVSIDGYGVSELAVALKVSGYPSENKNPHITLAINTLKGGMPNMSNDITEWKKLNSPIKIKGVVKNIWTPKDLMPT